MTWEAFETDATSVCDAPERRGPVFFGVGRGRGAPAPPHIWPRTYCRQPNKWSWSRGRHTRCEELR